MGSKRGAVLSREALPRVAPRAHAVAGFTSPVSGDFFAFVALLTVYLALAVVLVFGVGGVHPDAWSRVGNAYYVLYSRDPHLAAMGFVWNPLPSMVVLPLLPLHKLWPELVTIGFASNIVSALAMAASVVVVLRILRDLRLPLWVQVTFTAAYAFHPLIVYYAANGMSEALFLLFLLWSCRGLMLWARGGETTALVSAGLALALAYLTRYEAVGAAALASIVVAVVAFAKARGPIRARLSVAGADVVVLVLPVAVAFGGWALASWLITGSPFQTFTSLYGNSSQVELASRWIGEATGQGTGTAPAYLLRQVLGLTAAVPLIAVAALTVGTLKRDTRAIAPLAILGGVLAFAAWAFLSGQSFGWLRFYIGTVPLTVVLGACAVAANGETVKRRVRFRSRTVALGATAVAICLVVQNGLAAGTLIDPALAREEVQATTILAGRPSSHELTAKQMAVAGAAMASHVDALAPGSGTVLIDAATGFPIILQSRSPTQFIITSDRDFEAALADPAIHGVRYLIVENDDPRDAVLRTYPGLAHGGGDLADLVAEYASGPHVWRLYAVRERVLLEPDQGAADGQERT